MTAYILRRFVQLIPTFLGATFLAFMVIQMAPGDFVSQFEDGTKITPQTIARMREKFGLDQPWYVQYLLWLNNILHLDLGYSFAYQQPVLQVIWPRVVNSMLLVGLSTIILFLLAIPIGIYGATRQYSLGDQVTSFLAYMGLAIPSFFLALLVIYGLLQFKFAFGFSLFPVGGMTSSGFDQFTPWQKFLDIGWHLMVPALIATANDVAGNSRLLRGQMLEVLSHDFVRTARAKGLSQRAVIYKHALRTAVIPFIAGIGGLLPGLVSGAGFVEVVTNWPGVTPFFLDALTQQDLYVLTGFLVITLLLLMIGNLLSDLLLAWVDPRIRYE